MILDEVVGMLLVLEPIHMMMKPLSLGTLEVMNPAHTIEYLDDGLEVHGKDLG